MSFQKIKNLSIQEQEVALSVKSDLKKSFRVPEDNEKITAHYRNEISLLKKEIKYLQQDIASLVSIIAGTENKKLTAEESRKIYFDFRSNPSHVLMRITNKISEKGESNL